MSAMVVIDQETDACGPFQMDRHVTLPFHRRQAEQLTTYFYNNVAFSPRTTAAYYAPQILSAEPPLCLQDRTPFFFFPSPSAIEPPTRAPLYHPLVRICRDAHRHHPYGARLGRPVVAFGQRRIQLGRCPKSPTWAGDVGRISQRSSSEENHHSHLR